jgi:hypothetical protein
MQVDICGKMEFKRTLIIAVLLMTVFNVKRIWVREYWVGGKMEINSKKYPSLMGWREKEFISLLLCTGKAMKLIYPYE